MTASRPPATRWATSGAASSWRSNLAWIQKPAWFGLPAGEGIAPSAATLPVRLAFLSVAVWWLVFSIPLFRRVPEPPARKDEPGAAGGHGARGRGGLLALTAARYLRTWRELRGYPQAVMLLLAFLLYNDGIGTIIRMAAIYGTTLGIPRGALVGSILVVQFVGFPFSFLFGSLAGRIGAKRAIYLGLAVYTGICVFACFMRTATHFLILAVLVGMVQGGTQALSRSLFAAMVPPEKSARVLRLLLGGGQVRGDLRTGDLHRGAGDHRKQPERGARGGGVLRGRRHPAPLRGRGGRPAEGGGAMNLFEDDEEGGLRLSRGTRRALVIVPAMMVLVAAAAMFGLHPGARWVIVSMTDRMGLEGVGVDPEEGQVLAGGMLGASGKSAVDVQLGEAVEALLGPDSRVNLPRPPGRWFRRGATVELTRGQIRGWTSARVCFRARGHGRAAPRAHPRGRSSPSRATRTACVFRCSAVRWGRGGRRRAVERGGRRRGALHAGWAPRLVRSPGRCCEERTLDAFDRAGFAAILPPPAR